MSTVDNSSMNQPSKETMNDLVFKTILENQKFFETNSHTKKIIAEIAFLADDAIGFIPKSDEITTKAVFSFHGFTPLSSGIYISLLTGNLVTCFMQLRLLVEFWALTHLGHKSYSDYDAFVQLKKVRKIYKKNISNMLKDADPKSLELWKSISNWIHAKNYSNKVIRHTIKKSVSLTNIVQPALYDLDDLENLDELKRYVKTFRKIVKKHQM